MAKRTMGRMRKAIRVAHKFCEREVWQFQEIDEQLKLPPGTSAHLLKYARKQGLLMVREYLPARLTRDTELGSQLGRAFYPTRFVVVDPFEPSSPSVRRRLERQREEDDLLHERLGAAAAEEIAPMLRNIDVVGVGAGRGVFHTARALAALPGPHRKRRRIVVMSLHGRSTRRIWRETSPYAKQSIDSVRVTLVLADAIPMSRSLPLHLRLVQENPRAVRDALDPDAEACFLSREAWKRRAPSLAVVGLGVMGVGPRAKPARLLPPRFGGARSIAPALTKLRSVCSQFRDRHGYAPVGDVCDRLFWVPDRKKEPRLRKLAEPVIATVNARLLTVDTGLPPRPVGYRPDTRLPGSLDQVQEVVLVAGGRHKVRALYRVLRHERNDGRRFADTLVTDIRTAEGLLELAQAKAPT